MSDLKNQPPTKEEKSLDAYLLSKKDKANHNEPTIKTMEEFKQLRQLFSDIVEFNKRKFLFRGQGISDWELSSSLKRKYDLFDSKALIALQKEFIKYYKQKHHNNINNLQILTKMKYYNTPTILIDFTTDFWHAFWFALSSEDNEKNLNKPFSIFYFEYNSIRDQIEENDWFSKNVYTAPKRIIEPPTYQKSYFVLDNEDKLTISKKDKIKKINFSGELREKILIFLANKDINSNTIFPNEKGFFKEFSSISSMNYFFSGYSEVEKGNYQKAEKMYRLAISLNSSYSPSFNNLGLLLVNQNRDKEAEEMFFKAIGLADNLPEPYKNLSNLFVKQNKIKEAIKMYKKTLELNPNDNEVYNSLGNLFEKQHKDKSAEEMFKKAISLNPSYSIAYNNLGLLYDKQNKLEDSERMYRKSLDLDFMNPNTYINFGNLFAKQKKLEQAEKMYRNALDVDHTCISAHSILGFLLESQGKYTDAETMFKKALELNVSDSKLYLDLGFLFVRIKKYKDAKKMFDEAIKIDSSHEEGILADLLAIKNETKEFEIMNLIEGIVKDITDKKTKK